MRVLGICGALLGLATLTLACGNNTSSSGLPKPTDDERATATRLIQQLQANGGLTRYNCETHEAYIPPAVWTGMDAEHKQSLTTALTAACNGGSMNIMDSQSGKRLARLDALDYRVE